MDVDNIIRLFSLISPVSIDIKNTSHGDDDFRETFIVNFGIEKIVIKLSANGFTDEKHLTLWERIAKEYRNLGYYCPQFIRALDGTFPTVLYKDRNCIAWAEEFSKYKSASELIKDHFADTKLVKDGYYSFLTDAMIMDAKVAACHFDYTDLPSGFCMFELFDPSDKNDETTEDAERWLLLAKALPNCFAAQVERIWNNWLKARKELKKIGGREVYINYLVRQAPYVSTNDPYSGLETDDTFLKRVLHAFDIVKTVYSFSELEKKAAPLLYKCIRPLWWYASVELKEAGTDHIKIQRHLDGIEYEQTREIDFSKHM